jgi:hypothetical protein
VSNHQFVAATAQLLRVLYNSSAINSKGQFCHGWKYRCRNLVDELAYFTDVSEGVIFVCNLGEASKFCKFSQQAWSLVKEEPHNTYLRTKGGVTHGEHAVPVSVVQRIAFNMLAEGIDDRQIAAMLSYLVEVVFITKEEQRFLDSTIRTGGMGLKTSMPIGWDTDVMNHDWSKAKPYSRFEAAGIQLAEETIRNSIREDFS